MNDENLRPAEYKLSVEEAKRGGKASVEARRRKKLFREIIEDILEEKDEFEGKPLTKKELATRRAIKVLLDDDTSTSEFLKAFEMVRDTIGEKPTERVDVSANQEAKDAIDKMVAMFDE